MSLQDALANAFVETLTSFRSPSSLPFGAGACYEGATEAEEP